MAEEFLPYEGFPAEETEEPAIQELLDEGYELLDGFVDWLEEERAIDTRTAQQDCYNAESLLDYLANHQRKSVFFINEFELRWFVFSHYIRKSIADRETEERLSDSLLRFFAFLRTQHRMLFPDWIRAVLDDQEFYLKRRSAYHALDQDNEAIWKEGFRDWCLELEQDLDTRCLWLPSDLGMGMVWGDVKGWREATLYEEANNNWQKERTEYLREGMDFENMRLRLLASFQIWFDTEQERLEYQSPREVISMERADSIVRDEDEDEDEDY